MLGLTSLWFLNLAEQPPAPELGQMRFDAEPYLDRQPLEMLVLDLTVSALGLNVLGDDVRDALDPRSRRL